VSYLLGRGNLSPLELKQIFPWIATVASGLSPSLRLLKRSLRVWEN